MNIRVDTPSGVPEGQKSSVGPLCGRPTPSISETDDAYPHVVVMLDGRTRVIAADIQWIIQGRKGSAWRGIYFCRSKAGLLMYAPKVTPELLALPDWFPEAA
jgi:hypothetical protein